MDFYFIINIGNINFKFEGYILNIDYLIDTRIFIYLLLDRINILYINYLYFIIYNICF